MIVEQKGYGDRPGYHEKDKGIGVMRDKEISLQEILLLLITSVKKRMKGNT